MVFRDEFFKEVIKMRSLGWALTYYVSLEEEEIGHRHPHAQRKCHMRTRREGAVHKPRREVLGEAGHEDTLTLDLWPPEL